MMNLVALAVFVGCVCTAQDMDPEDRTAIHDAFYNVHSDGDLILSETQKAALKNRNAIANLAQRWPGGVIPYKIDPSVSNIAAKIDAAAKHIADKTNNCIRFIRHTNQPKHVRIFYGNGCWSPLGMVGNGAQDLSIGPRCDNHGIIVHEMLHTVGFDHEQNRPDRDQFLNIFLQNVMANQTHNFGKTPGGRTTSSFDFDSIMLYGEFAFSANRQPTMQDKTRQHKLTEPYEKTTMSPTDVADVKNFYGCK